MTIDARLESFDPRLSSNRSGRSESGPQNPFFIAGELDQHVNKVSTKVTIRHVPTGISVTASDSRS
jgi:hypothetical protein